MSRDFYFAYGSNMDPDQMAGRCPAAVPLAVVALEGWDVAINDRGVATVVSDPATTVEGVLWAVTEDCLRALDRYEGTASGLYRRETLPVRLGGRSLEAIVYLAASSEPGEPRTGYLERILRGANHFSLSVGYRQRLEALAGWGSSFSSARRELRALAARVGVGEWGEAKLWGGARVAIVPKALPTQRGEFYPPPRFIVTEWAPRLSWAFEQITAILGTKPFYCFETKFEIFARLADAADRGLSSASSPAEIVQAVIAEAIATCSDLEAPSVLAW